jgi:hypothetical protein
LPGVTVAPRNRDTFSAAIGLIGCSRSDRTLVKKGTLKIAVTSPFTPMDR